MDKRNGIIFIFVLLVLVKSLPALALNCEHSFAGDGRFIRGDANVDGQVNSRDSRYLFTRLKLRLPYDCAQAADVNYDNRVDSADLTYLARFLRNGISQPQQPYPLPGFNPHSTAVDTEIRSLALLYVRESNYFAEHNTFNSDLTQAGFLPYANGSLPHFSRLIYATGSWPPAGFPQGFQGTAAQWAKLLGSLPQASIYAPNNNFALLKSATQTLSDSSFWSILIGEHDNDAQAEVWLVDSGSAAFRPKSLAGDGVIIFPAYSEASGMLNGFYITETAFFVENGAYSLALEEIGFGWVFSPIFFKKLVVGFGSWPPAGFDPTASRTLAQWQAYFQELPGAHTYRNDTGPFVLEHVASTPYTGSPDSFWAVNLGDLDFDPGADIWFVQSSNRTPAQLIADYPGSGAPPVDPSSEAKIILSGIYTSEVAYFAEMNEFSLDLYNQIGFVLSRTPVYFGTLIMGYGAWPPAGFDPTLDRTFANWKKSAGELPGAVTFRMEAGNDIVEHVSSIPYAGSSGDGFWAIVIGNVDSDAGADVWLVTNMDRNPLQVDSDL